ncbi:radical SAM protein [Vibrio salinus]|uniref:radical SAM protein n=1 Tax=Vibrio salinus TaxID=2899784 RepID=UPI001E36B44B|nr:radical SAM protein [Vibrio salinus]MCE0493775.1 radical SAM protein [Vibrio salinus]
MKILSLNFPIFVKWYITGRCSLRCKHCYLTNYNEEKEVNLETIEKIVSYLSNKGVKHICILGGEPTEREDLNEIIKICYKNNIVNKIATNGISLNKNKVRDLITSGLREFQISLDGHNAKENDYIRGKNSFNKAVSAINSIKTYGAWCSIAFTVNKYNIHSLEEMFILAEKLNVDELKIVPFIPVGTGSKINKLNLEKKDFKLIKEVINKHKITTKININSYFCEKVSCNKTNSCFTFGCGAGTNTLIINNDLTLSACDLLTEEDRTDKPIQTPEDIDFLWNNNFIFNKWRGLSSIGTKCIKDFSDVHNNGCHVANYIYKEDIVDD